MLEGVVPAAEEAEHDDLDRGRQALVEREGGGEGGGEGDGDGHCGPLDTTSTPTLPHGRVVRRRRSSWLRSWRTCDVTTLRVMPERPDGDGVFAERLAESIRRAGIGKGEFAERAGVDRTTLSQLLSADRRRSPRLGTVLALATEHDLSIDWLVGLSNVGPLEAQIIAAHVVRGPGSVADRRAPARMAERRRRLQDPLRPGHPARPAEVRRRHPLRALGVGRAWRGTDDRHHRGAAGVGAQPGHRDGVLLVGPGAALVRHGARASGPASARRLAATNSSG